MSELFDDLTRVAAAPISRRQALKVIAGMVGAVILSRFASPPRLAKAIECDDELYPFQCTDICCRYDYYCASTTLLNGGDTYGICCEQGVEHLCSAGEYGWCCDNEKVCGNERFACGDCAAGLEACGSACCNPATEFCCDFNISLCCPNEVECCHDTSDVGTCCPEDTKCTPILIPPNIYPGGRMCCPVDQACKGQCCPAGEWCIFQLACCPVERTTPDRLGCCPSGFLHHLPTHSCCMEGLYCGDVCCTEGTKVCINGTCQECPSGTGLCFDKCCAPGTCCFGKCCGDGQTCTGECTTLETITETVDPSNGGTLNSSDGGVTIDFVGIGYLETVQYTSLAQPVHALPENTQLLRSFTLTTPTAMSRPQDVEFVFYTMRVRYTQATLAAMGVESEFQLQLLFWDPSSSAWVPPFNLEIDRSEEEVIGTQSLLGEFALVAGEENPYDISATYLPLVIR